VSRWFSLPLAASIAGHGCVLVLLILLVERLPPVPLPEPKAGIEIMLAPAELPPEPVVEPPPPAPQPPPIPAAEPPPPEPPPAVVEPEPPPRVATPEPAKPPPPRPKPVVKRPPQPVHMPPPEPARVPEPVRVPPPTTVQTAAIPRPAPPPTPSPTPTGPIVSAGYRAALSFWLESHKRYPESARARGEEGRAVLRFRVARSGRVLSYAVVQGTGYADLDAAIDQMMRGASLPPFPGDMTAADVDVSVTIRFALAR
jgi:protein TonB